ncbi:MAG: DUF5686 and carboxypeptidase regulatory-like domain-containing protein [Tannerellaceae bacterium]|nr:DUF5686 and carboxypeptidase regulatory-like domain-containing protein [Tannerellaceae bacterium]
MAKKIVYIFLFVGLAWVARSQNVTVTGIVTDSITGEALPYVAVLLEGTTTGSQTDDDGAFTITTTSNARTLRVSYLGYAEKRVSFTPGRNMPLRIELAPTNITLSDVIVRPGKERYSKKENPAVIFVRNIIKSRESNNPRNADYFTYDHYEKMIFAMNDFNPKPKADSTKTGRFDFLVEFIDTLDMGRTILPVSEKERFETVYYRKDPKGEKRLQQGNKSAGVDEIFSRDGVHQLLSEVFREVDIFQNDIPLFLNRFVSPLSTQGPNFYKYYLLDTLTIDNQQVVDLGFVPFNSETWGFTGHLYVTLDSTFFVQRVVLNVPRNINLNFVDNMTIDQTFIRTEDGTRIMTKDDIEVDFKLSPKSKGMYARRLIVYSNHTFEKPSDEELEIFKKSAPVITVDDALKKPDEFWIEVRPEEMQNRNQNTVERLMARLRSVPLFYATEKIVSILVSGYIQTNPDKTKSKFEFGPMNTAYSWNAIEGNRFRVCGTTTVNFSDRIFLDGYAAYGTKDEKFKYDLIAEYSFIPKKDYRKEFPVHSLRFEYLYDINQIGQQYAFTSKDNIFIAWKWHQDDRATCLRKAELTYSNESWNGFSYFGVLRNYKEYSTRYAEFNKLSDNGQTITPMKDYQMTEFEVRLRYAPNEKFYQSRNYRYSITLDAPVFTLSHTIAGKDVLGSDYTYNRTEFGIQKRFWFSAYGYVDIYGKAGKVWDAVPYPLLIIPNANISYSVYPESYTNMLPLEFLNDEYASWDVTYYMNGALFNRIPLLKKLKWREVASFRGLYGNLTDKNNPINRGDGLYEFPEGSYAMGNKPYMEYSLGIENIFKFIRIDYTRRLNYLEHPGTPKHGFRFMMKMTF